MTHTITTSVTGPRVVAVSVVYWYAAKSIQFAAALRYEEGFTVVIPLDIAGRNVFIDGVPFGDWYSRMN